MRGMVKKSAGEPAPTSQKRQRIDWEAVERDFATGKYTDGELAAKHKTSRETVAKRRSKDQKADPSRWQKDLTKQVRDATKALLMHEAVTKEVTGKITAGHTATAILFAAEVSKQVILGQRNRIGRAVDVSMRMLDELDATTTKADEFGRLFDLLTEDMDELALAAARAKFNDLLRLHSRIGSAQKLMDALNRAQIMERQAFQIDDGDGDSSPAAVRPLVGFSTEELRAALRGSAE